MSPLEFKRFRWLVAPIAALGLLLPGAENCLGIGATRVRALFTGHRPLQQPITIGPLIQMQCRNSMPAAAPNDLPA